MVGSEQKDYFIGSQAVEKRALLVLKNPIKHGAVEDWEDLEKVLDHCFTNELRVPASDQYVMVTEPPLNPKSSRERLTQILFDTFNVPGLYLVTPQVLSIYSAGKFTGVVVDCGDEVTHVVPIFDGYALFGSVMRTCLGGRDITQFLTKLLNERGLHLTSSTEQDQVKKVKEKLGYVALDLDRELAAVKAGTVKDSSFDMPDGSVIHIGSERFRAPEVLFNPSLIGREFDGLPHQVRASIQNTDSELRSLLFQNVVLTGGSSSFPGLPERLTTELKKLAPPNLASKVKVTAVPDPSCAAWIGGSILSSINTFSCMWITKEEYQDAGPAIVHRKCL